MEHTQITNEKLVNYSFLEEMYADDYFPNFLVDKGKVILIEMCLEIEKESPTNLSGLYEITHASTLKFNELQEEFFENDSEIETAARECIAVDFDSIAKAYGYDADMEELIGPRDW